MRYAVISDVHANIEALDAVLLKIDRLGVDKIICCGDLVGYYASPNECIQTLATWNVQCVAGNHDLAAAGLRELGGWEVAEKAIAWTKTALSSASFQTLQGLPKTLVIDQRFLVFHGALHPEEFPESQYLFHDQDVIETMHALTNHSSGARLGFFGHTHRALVYSYREQQLSKTFDQHIILDEDSYYLINPGSVGQPRDGNTAASFLIFDDGTRSIQFYRVPYDVIPCLKRAKKHRLLPDPRIKSLAKRVYRKASKLLKTS